MSKLQKALAEIGKSVGYVQKDAKNSHHGYKYASAEAVLSKVREACYANGVVVSGSSVDLVHADGPSRVVRITQTYSLGDESATFQGLGEGKGTQDKATMKANTAAIKYLLTNAFNISWGDDPEVATEADKEEVSSRKGKRTSTRRSKSTSAGSSKPSKDDVLGLIASAEDLDTLQGLMSTLVKFRKTPDEYKVLREAYGVRKDALAA